MIPIPKLLKAGTWIISKLPRWLAYAGAKLWGTLQFHQDARRRNAILKNLSLIDPSMSQAQKTRLARRSFQMFAMNSVDFLLAPVLQREQILNMVLTENDHEFTRLIGKGFILLSAHLGNWEFAVHWTWAKGARGVVVAEKIENADWFEEFKRYRSRPGIDIVPQDANPMIWVRTLKNGRMLILLGDRDITGSGFRARFFSGTKDFPKGPASISHRLGVPVLVGCVVRRNTKIFEKRPYLAKALGVIEPEGLSLDQMRQQVVANLQKMIQEFPEQWFVFQDEWQNSQEKRTETNNENQKN